MKEYSFNASIGLVKESTGQKIVTPEQAYKLCADMGQAAQEMMVVIDLNSKNRVVDKRLVTLGLVNASLVMPREMFCGAIKNMASSIVMVHNHPSGDPTPSAEDVRITRQMVEAGKILGITVLDHVVIGRGDTPFFSLREQGLCNFAA